MASFTTTAERIIRQPALTMPGNATGSEAACTSLTASQIRTLLSLGTTSDVTFDIVRATTSVQTPLVNNASAALTLGNSTYGVTVPGQLYAVASGATIPIIAGHSAGSLLAVGYYSDANPYIYNSAAGLYLGARGQFQFAIGADSGGTNHKVTLSSSAKIGWSNSSYADAGVVGAHFVRNSSTSIGVKSATGDGDLTAGAATFSGDISMSKTSAQGYVYAYDTTGANYIAQRHTGTAGEISTNSGNLNLVPTGGTVAVTGGIVAAGDISMQKATQGYIRAFEPASVKSTAMYHDGTNGILSTSSGNLRFELGTAGGYYDFPGVAATNNPVRIWNNTNTSYLQLRHTGNSEVEATAGNLTLTASASGKYIQLKPNAGLVDHYLSGVNSVYRAWNGNGNGYVEITHDSTNGIVSTVNTANLNLVPAGGTVAVTGGITASGVVSHGAYTVATLPSAGSNAGKMAQVTDSNVAASGNYGATVAAGGANRVKVFSDGTNWVIA